jgi:tetratricopeptide (TPR) repeat protein
MMINRIVAASLALLATLSAAQSSRKKAPSSAEMKKRMMDSYLFKATDIFYPQGTMQASDYPRLTDSGMKALEAGLREMLPTVADLHARNAEALGRFFERKLPPSVQATVVLEVLNAPIAQSLVNEQGALEIRIDVHVLQATFRAGLISALRDPLVYQAEFGKKVEKTDDELIRDFLLFKKEVLDAKAGTRLGDVFKGGDRWSTMVDLADRSDNIQRSYVGTLMFLMAHEFGHFVLNHHQHSCDISRCGLFSNDELEADRYAGYLQGALVAPMTHLDEMSMGMLSMLDPTHRKKLAGFNTFFDDAYARVGFVDPSKARCSCSYPDPAARRQTAESGQKAALARFEQLLETDPVAAQRTTPMKVALPKVIESRTDDAESLIAAGKYEEALPLVRNDARDGSPAGMFYLGYFYYAGLAVKQDFIKAREWLEKAATAGVPSAMTTLGLLYYKGQGVTQDYDQTRQWLKKAAAAGDARAKGLLGAMAFAGDGEQQDFLKARELFESAIAAGDNASMTPLCLIYYEGRGIAKDYKQALHWCNQAAAAGSSAAMEILGYMYRDGNGVDRDSGQARQWFQKAVDAGNTDAKERLKELPK